MALRWLTTLPVAVIIGFCALSGLMLAEMRQEAWQHDVQGARNLMTAEGDDIARTFANYDLSLRAAAASVSAAEVAPAGNHGQQAALFGGTAKAGYFGPVRVIDADGVVTHDSFDSAPAPASPAERDALSAHRDNPRLDLFISKPYGLTQAGDGDIGLSHRIETPDGRFAGIVTGTIRVAYFSELFHRLQLGPHDVVSLFSDGGTMLAHAPGTAHIGQSIKNREAMRLFNARREGTIEAVSGFDHVRRIYSFTHLDHWPLLLDVGLAKQDVYASWNRRALFVGFCLITMGLFSFLLLRTLRLELRRRLVAERRAQANEARYRLLADNSSDLILRFDNRLIRTYVSPSCRAYGYQPGDLLGLTPESWVHPEDWPLVKENIRRAQSDLENVDATYRIRRNDGTYVWVEGRYNYVPADGGFIALLRDVSARKEAELKLEQANSELKRIAAFDSLTGLANRRSFDERLEEEWYRAFRAETNLAILVIDVDFFKAYNDRYGHQAGDVVLSTVAGCVQAAMRRSGDFVARYGGEEFVVILPNTDFYGAIEVAEACRRSVFELGVLHEGSRLGVLSVSIGASCVEPRVAKADAAHLFKVADDALYLAKNGGRNQVQAKHADRISDTRAPGRPAGAAS